MISFLAIDADKAWLCCKCNRKYVNIEDHFISECISECSCVHLERVSLGDKILQLNTDVYILLRGLDKETITNVFLGEALADLTALLSEDLALFRYLSTSSTYFMDEISPRDRVSWRAITLRAASARVFRA